MSKRAWIKIYCQKILETDISADLSTFGAWIKLLCIAGDSNHGDIGVIQINDKLGLSTAQVGHLMSISGRQWCRYKDIFVREGMITVTDKNIIIINNWSKYQSEYGRQKSYRQGYKSENIKVTNKVTPREYRVKSKEKRKEKNKHIYGEYKHVRLTDEEVIKLKDRLNTDYDYWIAELDEGIEMKGYKIKSHYLAILKWKARRKEENSKYL